MVTSAAASPACRWQRRLSSTTASWLIAKGCVLKRSPIQRAADWWESPRFQAVSLAQSWFHQSGVVSPRPPAGNTHCWEMRTINARSSREERLHQHIPHRVGYGNTSLYQGLDKSDLTEGATPTIIPGRLFRPNMHERSIWIPSQLSLMRLLTQK